MRNLNDVIESIKNDTSTIGTKAPKIRNLSDVSKTSYFNIDDFKDEITKIAPAPDVESDLDVRLREGIDRGVQSVKNLPEHLQIFQGQMTMALGGLAGSEENVEIGRELIKSAFGEIQADEKKFYENSIPLSEKDYDSFGYALGNGVANYGSMLAFGYLTGGVGGLALGGALETGSKAREKIEYHIEKTGDNALDQYTSTQAGKDALFTAVYSAGSTIIEKKFGYGAQRKLFKMPVGQHLKNIYKSALSEGGTETAQELYAVGLDLLGGYIDYSKLPERFLGAVQEGVIGSVLGGTAGVGTAMAHRSQAKSILREELKNTVPAKDLENVVNSVYEEVSDTMTKVVATELVQSESLRNKHGAIYESLKTEIIKQITDSGAYTDVDEFTLSQYIESTAKDFADQVLGEANKRKVTIDDVLKASDITYRDGRLYLQGKIEKPKATRKPRQYNPERMELLTYLKYIGGLKDVGGDLKAMDAGKLKIGLINNKSGMSLDDAMLYAWERGYFPEFVNRPTVDDLLEAIRDGLSGKKRYRESFRPVVEAREAKAKGLLAEAENEYLFDSLLSARFTDDELKDMPLDVKEKLYVEMVDQINAISDEDYIQQEINSLTEDELERYAIMTENGATHDEAMQEIINNRTPEEYLYFQFAGTKAKTANLEKLNIAKQLELEGVSGEDIRKQTGWFKGVDGKWRFEISDNDAEVVLLDEFKQTLTRNIDRAWDEKDKESLQEKLSNLNSETIYKTMAEQDVRYSYYLGDILKHDKLYQAYPFLRNIIVRFSKMHENLGASVSYYNNNAMSGLIEINLTSKHFKYSDLKKVLMHEVQHIIQREEKFARGGSQEEYDDYVKYVKSEYDRFKTGLFMSFIKDEFGVDIHYTHAIKIMDDIFRGDKENKKYIYEENKIDRSELIKAVNKKVDELSQKEQNYRDEKYKRIPKNSYEFYLRLAGELEARITEEREGLTDEQRLIEPIEEKRNKIKNADAIVVFDDGGTYAYNNESISSGEYYQTEVIERTVNNFTDRSNPTRITKRTIEDLLPEELTAFNNFLNERPDKERILRNLNNNKYDDKGKITGYYKAVIEGIFTQQAVNMYFRGETPDFESAIDATTSKGSLSRLKKLFEGSLFKNAKTDKEKVDIIARNYLAGSVLAHPTKVVNAVNSSLINCNPSPACAKFCYATKGNYSYISNLPKAEILDIVAKKNPVLLAEMIANEWKSTTEYSAGKALRLFDKGDGNDSWVIIAKELNKLGVRVAIFTKKPDFMRKINELKDKNGNEINLTMLSIDSTNQQLAEENKDLRIAYVYQGEDNLSYVKKLQDEKRLQVLLPVKLGSDFMSKSEVDKLAENGIDKKHICPIDAGWFKLHKANDKSPTNMVSKGELKPVKVGEWNCALCDRFGGVGCYLGRTTRGLMELLKDTEKNNLQIPKNDVDLITEGLGEILLKQNVTKELTDEQLKQFGITEQQVAERIRLLSPAMGESNARVFAGYSLLLSWFGQRQNVIAQSVQNKARETGLLAKETEANRVNNGEGQSLLRQQSESSKGEQSYSEGIPADISEDSGTNVRLDEEYYQKSKKQNKIKGAFDKLTKSIEITSEADYSTYKHEFAHFWLDNIWNYANSGQASENYLKQFNEIKKWLGNKGNYPTRNQHEKFARAYEKYIYNGTYAKSPIGDVFGEYENFIREVYSDISEIDTRAGEKKYKPIPRVVYNFFDSMVSGKLPGVIIDDEPKKEVEKDEKEVREFIKEENKILEENRANYTLKPVQTDTKTGYLTAYEKMTGEQVEAGSMELKDQMEKAENFVANNLEQAERIVNGLEQAPEGIVKNAVYVAYNNLQKKLGNTDKRANSMLNQALELRRMGQEIASQRLAYADVEGEASATFWIKEVIKNKAEALADANGLTVTELSDKIDNAISDGIANNKKPEDIVKQLGEELGVTEFYQTEVLSGFGDVDTYAHSYIKRYVNERLGLGMSKTEAETIIRKADDMLASLQNSRSETTGNPSVDYFVKLKDMENYANSLAPSSEMRVAMSVIGRGNLLASIKSPVTNIVSNGFVGAFRGAVRRINLGVANSIVSPELIKQNKAYSWEIFKKTGYNVNNITKDKPRNLILGEKLTHSEGKGFIRGLGRLYEKTVYKWGLGAGDVVFKDYAFTDYVALKATKLANGDVAKANEIFKDACLIEPKTKDGAEIREEAVQESLIATYQNDSAISDRALKVRKTMDFGVGFGEFIAPFVKTPANVVSMGLKSSFGGLKAIVSEIQRDLKAGKIQPMTKENIDLLVQNGLGILVASLLMSAIDDDDYMPPYALASSKDKQLAKELNIPYNAIRINIPLLGLDNTWISLDYFGVLASPLVGLLQARREDGVINSIFGYAKSGGIQTLSIPAFGNVADLFENIKNTVRKDGIDALADAGGELLEQAYARIVPSIVSDVAKALDSYDRETKGNEIITKIPFARETADKRVSATTGKAEKLGNPVFDILFGARVKEQVSNPVANELLRLNNAGWGVSLTTVTRSGLLSELDEETKQKVREDFATEYSKDVSRLIKSFRYSKADDEEKQEMINKIRRDIISKLKKRYLKNRK